MAPTPGALPAGAFDEGRDVRGVALHAAAEVVAEKAAYAVGVGARRVDEGNPGRVGPAPHRSRTDAVVLRGVEDRKARRVRAQESGPPRLLLDGRGQGAEPIDPGGDGAPERLRRGDDAGPLPH